MPRRARVLLVLVGAILLPTANARAQRVFWTIEDLQTGAQGKALALGGDLDGDGFGDILVAQPERGSDRGRVQARGSRLAVSIQVWVGEVDGDQFGFSVAIAKDVDGDGFDDALIGAPFHDGPGGEDAGRVYLFSGGSGALLRFWDGEAPSAHFGHGIATVGDANGDGVVDVAVGAPGQGSAAGARAGRVTFYSGRTGSRLGALRGEQAGESFGWSISASGDVDRDGRADVVIGSPYWRDAGGDPVGKAEVFSGKTGGRLRSLVGTWREGRFGWSVAIAGDIDGDGADDILVGGPGYGRLTGPSTGEARLYSGRTGALLRSVVGSARGNEAGYSVAPAGDLDLDGYEDFAVGSPGRRGIAAEAGSAAVLSGRTGNPIWTGQGDEEGARFGAAIAGGADINRDGMAEVVVGAPGEGVLRGGRVHVVGRPPDCLNFWDGPTPGMFFGSPMTLAGDVDGDGYDDLLAGGGHNHNGFACVYSGATHELLWMKEGGPGDGIGETLGGGLDLDGDGLADAIIGSGRSIQAVRGDSGEVIWTRSMSASDALAVLDDVDGDGHGEIVVSGAGTETLLLSGRTGEEIRRWPGRTIAMANAGDVDGDGLSDLLLGRRPGVVTTRVELYSPATGELLWSQEGENRHDIFGRSVAGAGDFDGDGVCDVAVECCNPYSHVGEVRVYSGATGLVLWSLAESGNCLGPVSSPGDVNEDGRSDLLIGAFNLVAEGARGKVLLVAGGTGEILWCWRGEIESYTGFGGRLSHAGDVNADGIPGFLIGAGAYRPGNYLGRVYLASYGALLPIRCRAGGVNAGVGEVTDVLLVNDSTGVGLERVVDLDRTDPFMLRMERPPAVPAVQDAPFALYAWEGEPGPDDVTLAPFGLGYTSMPTPLTGGRADVVWNNAHPALGVATCPSRPAPTDVVTREQGLGREVSFTVQGIIFDPGSKAGVPASITNAIVLRVR